MEQKEYAKLIQYLDRQLDRGSLMPGLMGIGMVHGMSAAAQRKLAQAVLTALATWADLTYFRNDDEVWLHLAGSMAKRVGESVRLDGLNQ
jgi:hypothetical protein